MQEVTLQLLVLIQMQPLEFQLFLGTPMHGLHQLDSPPQHRPIAAARASARAARARAARLAVGREDAGRANLWPTHEARSVGGLRPIARGRAPVVASRRRGDEVEAGALGRRVTHCGAVGEGARCSRRVVSRAV